MSYALPRNHGCRISDAWTYQGLRTIILENELIRVVVLADKGTDIVEFRYKPLDLDFMLQMPAGVRNPNRGLLSSPSSGTFIDYYNGGWNDILPNGGPFSTYNGAEFGQHGEISLIPWEHQIVEDSPERVAVRLWVRPIRTPFFVEKTLCLEPGRAVLTIDERVTNEAGQAMHLMWGQHIAFGRPFLDEGAVIDVPAKRFLVNDTMPNYEPRRFKINDEFRLAARAQPPMARPSDASVVPAYGAAEAQEMAYLTELTDGWYAITNPTRQVGFGVRFDPSLFRYIWYWQQLGDVGHGLPVVGPVAHDRARTVDQLSDRRSERGHRQRHRGAAGSRAVASATGCSPSRTRGWTGSAASHRKGWYCRDCKSNCAGRNPSRVHHYEVDLHRLSGLPDSLQRQEPRGGFGTIAAGSSRPEHPHQYDLHRHPQPHARQDARRPGPAPRRNPPRALCPAGHRRQGDQRLTGFGGSRHPQRAHRVPRRRARAAPCGRGWPRKGSRVTSWRCPARPGRTSRCWTSQRRRTPRSTSRARP